MSNQRTTYVHGYWNSVLYIYFMLEMANQWINCSRKFGYGLYTGKTWSTSEWRVKKNKKSKRFIKEIGKFSRLNIIKWYAQHNWYRIQWSLWKKIHSIFWDYSYLWTNYFLLGLRRRTQCIECIHWDFQSENIISLNLYAVIGTVLVRIYWTIRTRSIMVV